MELLLMLISAACVGVVRTSPTEPTLKVTDNGIVEPPPSVDPNAYKDVSNLIQSDVRRGDVTFDAGNLAEDVPVPSSDDTMDNSLIQSLPQSSTSFGPVKSPFFFMCHYPRPGETSSLDQEDDDFSLSVSLSGIENLSEGYEPLRVYEVLVTSNVLFDGFLITGVHAVTKEFSDSNYLHLPTSSHGGSSEGLVCAVLHSHISRRPRPRLSFLWMAPPSGTGCVAFLAQGSLRDKILFKDLNVMEVCEKESEIGQLRLLQSHFTGRDQYGYVFRDDFEGHGVDGNIWDEMNGGEIDYRHGPVIQGAAVSFSEPNASIATHPMDLSNARQLQFALGSGNCNGEARVRLLYGSAVTEDAGLYLRGTDVPMMYGPVGDSEADLGSGDLPNGDFASRTPDPWQVFVDEKPVSPVSVDVFVETNCYKWEEIHTYSTGVPTQVHIQNVPRRFRGVGVCVKWEVVSDEGNANSSCWGLDNVAISKNEASLDPVVDDFDPVDPSNWLFFTGAQVKESCGSEGNSLVFQGQPDTSWTTTRLMNLRAQVSSEDIILERYFLHAVPQGWYVEGGSIGRCQGQLRIIFSDDGNRRLCTPFMDARSVGVVEIRMQVVGGDCSDSPSDGVSVAVYAEHGDTRHTLAEIRLSNDLEDYMVPVLAAQQIDQTRFCIEQNEENANQTEVWVVDRLRLLPWMPSQPEHFFQARLNLGCLEGISEVDIETSNDGGKTWVGLHRRCLPGGCPGGHSALTSTLSDHTLDSWGLVTLPLPYASLTPHTRLRVRQLNSSGDDSVNSWALDNVFIGKCAKGCNGRGLCLPEGHCKCEYGYSGTACETSDTENPVYVSEPFTNTLADSANILKVKGGTNAFRCGVVGSGLAAVFSARGPRFLTTIDINSTNAHFIQFNFVAGTVSDVGKCPGPDEAEESVYVHYSCDGGVTWHLLHTLYPQHYKEPSHVSLDLPGSARGPSCRFQLWQEKHSGAGRDIWAVDDLTVTSRIFNSIELDFSDGLTANNSLRFHRGTLGGRACDRDTTLLFDDVVDSSTSRFMETKSIGVGPSFMMQFDLVIGCDENFARESGHKVLLEYSLNHGITWSLVHRPCSPSTPGCESHFTRGTVYDSSEFHTWRRVTLRLPRHTWSPTTRLRLRQTEQDDVGESWAVDNLYIGRQCPGLCSGHGYCKLSGCQCDDEFHGHKCLPLHKLYRQIDASFDEEDDIAKYDFEIIGGNLVDRAEGCGPVVSQKSVYFGAPGVRQFETDDLNVEELEIIQFMLVIGGGTGTGCIPGDEEERQSAGSIAVEYSNDGGISWSLIQELLPSQYRSPRLFRAKLEEEMITPESGIIRFRVWQPTHSDDNQWAIDNFRVAPDIQLTSLQADFAPNSVVASPWLSVTGNQHSHYCGSNDMAQILDGEEPVRLAVTNPLKLSEDDIISFQISVGCSSENKDDSPVLLQYSKDGGVTWFLVEKGCPSSGLHCIGPKEASVYHPGHHRPWSRVLINVDHRLAQGTINLRWMQENPGETSSGEFGLRDLYIGPPCRYSCHGHGLCTAAGICKCEKGYNGTYCGKFPSKNSKWMHDNFDDTEMSPLWERTEGASVAQGCGAHHTGNALLFSAPGPRFATTKEMDTRNVKYLVFNLQIGSTEAGGHCQPGQVPQDNVALEYSTDNTQTWNTLQHFESTQTVNRQGAFFIPLPMAARTRQTRFRWWQGYDDMMLMDAPVRGERAEWHLDNVMVMANESLPLSLYDSFEGNSSVASPWFLREGANIGDGCNRDEPLLLFSGKTAPKYAETWDFEASESSVVQFDLKIGCEEPALMTEVELQYSIDNGNTWNLLRELCAPPQVECETFHLPSTFSTSTNPAWTRVTATFPKRAFGERTRLRLIEVGNEGHGGGALKTSWGLDNFFVGNSCPWMCSGHGYCSDGHCLCDDGYFGEFCVPAQVLPCELLDTFNSPSLNESLWLDSHGTEVSQRCGVLVSKTALVFFKEGLRLATTIDLDMTAGQFVQFTLYLGCDKVSTGNRKKRNVGTFLEEVSPVHEDTSRTYGILVQYSINGGVTWSHLKEIHYKAQENPLFVSIELDDFPLAQTNATRFRVWQPRHGGVMAQSWAIDNLFIGGMPVMPNILYETFDGESPEEGTWIDWPAGTMGQICDDPDSNTGMVFKGEEGEHALYTRDLTVDRDSVLQFDIRVGCGDITGWEHNVSLQYSPDYGSSWHTVRPLSEESEQANANFLHELRTPTVYYPNSMRKWTRIVIPLDDLHICGTVRFRWWQGYYGARVSSAVWGVDSVYIGPACRYHCGGHGYCINGDQCDCDDDYQGQESCFIASENPQNLNEDFEAGALDDQFERWSGGEVSRFCSVLTGVSLVFLHQGERMLVTKDLDLTHGSVVQFYIRFGCSPLDLAVEDGPVLLQFSTDGGISWTLLAELGRETGAQKNLPHTQHVTLPLPDTSKSNATRLRWWQPTRDGLFKSAWAIDQIHIGSTALGLPAFMDIDTGAGWLLRPGSIVEPVCDNPHNSIHFTNREGYRFAETPDIVISEHSFIQFTAVLGCKESGACFEVEIEYSIDQGVSWWPLKEHCFPSNPDCTEYWPSATLISDLYIGPTEVTMRVPYRARKELTRVRFIQRDGWRQQHTWALSHVYVGDECYGLCSGHGFCDAGVCQCQKHWTGDNCETPKHPLPTFIAEDFTSEINSALWRKVIGTQITDHCGPIASGEALHFLGGCSRYLESVDLDLREALFVQFDLRTGCLDSVSGWEAGGDRSILVQVSCNAGMSWNTIKKLLLIHHLPTYVWLELPEEMRCLGGRVRWWQPDGGDRNRYDWALDALVIGGNVTPPDSLTYTHPDHLVAPMWLRRYNTRPDKYCDSPLAMHVMMSTPSEPALIQTTGIQIGKNYSINFQLALGCGATWDNIVEPVRLEYSIDHGNSWTLVREMCLPGNSSCVEIADASIFYAPLRWQRYVYQLDHIGPAKYVRFRWIQKPSSDVTGSHQWSLRDVYIGKSCPRHCLGRGSCIDAECHCDTGYAGPFCQYVTIDNVPFIRDEFTKRVFETHFTQVQGGLLSEGCGGLEEPPTATFQGVNTRMLLTRPVDTRSGKFVHFIAQMGSPYGSGVCKKAAHRSHNVFLQYSLNGGIRWHLLRELDHELYTSPSKEYIHLPNHARSPATTFRFWQPRLLTPPPAWSIDDLFIGGSEISPAQLLDRFEGEPTISEWLFAPHSDGQRDYCSSGTSESLVWKADSPGHRAITTQEIIIQDGHVLQFKISVGCGESTQECSGNPGVRLEYSLDGGVNGWDLVRDLCLPGTSPDPDCLPYVFHPQSVFHTDTHSRWRRITIPLPEKTWASTTQIRWVQEVQGPGSRVTPWSLDDVYVGDPCPDHCHGRGDCVEGRCTCDAGYHGESCEPVPSRSVPLPTSLVDGFENGVGANWLQITGGVVGLGCNSLAPYGHGKHLYFSGCGTRQAVTMDMDTRRASKIMFVLRIGSHDNTPSCHVDLSDPQRALDKGVILQYSYDNGVTWLTVNVHDPLDFRKARRIAYSLPADARQYGVQFRWWQPDHDGASTDQWAIDNVEIVLAQRKDTSKYDIRTLHDAEL